MFTIFVDACCLSIKSLDNKVSIVVGTVADRQNSRSGVTDDVELEFVADAGLQVRSSESR